MAEHSVETEKQLGKIYRQTVVIVSAEMFLVLILTVLRLVSPAPMPAAEKFDSTALMVLIIFIAAASFVIRRLFNRWERYKTAVLLGGVSKLIYSLRWNAVVFSGFGLIIGVIGFIAASFGGNTLDMLRAAGVAVVVFFVNFPRRGVWERIVWNLYE